MSTLALFAETPRAGDLGHRFLVTGENQSPERQIAEYMKWVDKDISFGANFIGVARSVQQHSGTSVRMGRETIVLAGVDVSRISRPSRDRLLGLIQKNLDRLEHLVLRKIDWSRLPRTEVVVRNAVLSQWLDEIRRLKLPETEWTGGPRPLAPTDAEPKLPRQLRSSRARVGAVLLSLCLILFVGGHLFFGTPRNDAGRSAAHPNPKSRGQGSKTSESESAIRNLADAWECSPDDVVRSLLRAADWERRRDADTLSLDAGLKDGPVLQLLNKVTSNTGVERLLVSPAVKSESGFPKFAIASPVTASGDVRKWLYNAFKKWDRLRESVANASNRLTDVGKADNLTRMMNEVAQPQPDVVFGVGFHKPVTPLFDKQDVMIWLALNRCRSTLEKRGIKQYFGKPVASVPDSELASFLAQVRVNRDAIFSALDVSRSQAAETAKKSQEQSQEKSVIDAYNAFEVFINHLARFDNQ